MTTKMMGIYTIKNLVTNQLYIGSAVNIRRRLKTHQLYLGKGTHPNPKLQNSWNKYGESNFRFQPEELVEDKEELIPTEQQWLDVLWKDFDLFNIYPVADSPLGMKRSEETKKLLSEKHKGQIPWNKGKTNVYSEETKNKITASLTGKKASDETKKKMSIARMGKKRPLFSEEWKKNISKSKKGSLLSEETKSKISLAQIGKIMSKEVKQKISETLQGHLVSPKTRQKISETLKKQNSLPESI